MSLIMRCRQLLICACVGSTLEDAAARRGARSPVLCRCSLASIFVFIPPRRFVFIPSVGLCSFHPSVCVHSIRRFVFIPSVGLCSVHPSDCVHSTRRFVFIPPVGLASVHSVTKYRYATSSAPRCFGAAITVSTMSTLLFSLHRRLCSFSTR